MAFSQSLGYGVVFQIHDIKFSSLTLHELGERGNTRGVFVVFRHSASPIACATVNALVAESFFSCTLLGSVLLDLPLQFGLKIRNTEVAVIPHGLCCLFDGWFCVSLAWLAQVRQNDLI